MSKNCTYAFKKFFKLLEKRKPPPLPQPPSLSLSTTEFSSLYGLAQIVGNYPGKRTGHPNYSNAHLTVTTKRKLQVHYTPIFGETFFPIKGHLKIPTQR